ncbi:flippase [uncultured Winogradskyella sp.]|uniref:flippase n=1 Tax=uncultured Winogradskyella sp. TaxID=395353 RepID=UPI003511EB3B
MKNKSFEIIEKAIKVFLLRILGYFFGFLFIWLIATKYGADSQGIYSIAFMFLLIGTMISKFGLETSLVKWVAKSTNIQEASQYYWHSLRVALGISVITASILFLLSGVISKMYDMPDISSSIQVAALCIPLLTSLEIASNYFKGEKKTSFFAIYFHLGRFLFAVFFIFLLYNIKFENKVVPILSFAFGLMVVVLMTQIHLHLYFTKKKTKRPKSLTLVKTKSMMMHSYPMMISSSIVLFMGWSDVFILGFFVDEQEIGVYSTAVKIATVLTFIYNAILTIVTPRIAELYYNNQKEELANTLYFSSMIIFLTGLPLFVLLLTFSDFFLSLFGEVYLTGSTVLRIILLGQFFNLITGAVGPFFQMTGRQQKLQQFIFIALLINVSLSIILVHFYSTEGVAIGSAVGMAAWNVLGAFYLYRELRIKVWVHFRKFNK